MRVLKHHGLSIFFGLIFLAALAGQAVAGYHERNQDEVVHARLSGDEPKTISFGRYLTSSDFGEAVMENWQSEYLQFTLFVLATVWLLQRGSPESKEIGKEGLESDSDQLVREHARPDSPRWARMSGVRKFLFSNSLLIVMGLFFLGSWFAHSVTGWSQYNSEQMEHGGRAVSWVTYVGTARFWETTLQNWQSEFLAVGSMVVLSIYLRQRGSPESKPVGASHESTGFHG